MGDIVGTESVAPARRIILEDTTLRDGEQAPGVALPRDAKLRIHDALVEAGVKWIEPGIPAMGGDELEFLKCLLARGSAAHLIAWNRGVKEDVKFSIDLGFKAVHIGLPTSDVHLKNSIGRDRGWLLDRSAELIKYAKDRGCFVSISAEDVGRTEPAFLIEYAAHVAEAGADRLRLSDTIGVLPPSAYAERVRMVRSAAAIDLQCHAHNDYGLAVANTVAGVEAGAVYFHVTVLGVGERAGMPDLAQVAASLTLQHGYDLGIDFRALPDLYACVSKELGIDPLPWQPVVGANVFAHESGIHANGVLKDPSTFEAISPELLGKRHTVVLGKHSGRAAIRDALKSHYAEISEHVLPECLEEVRQISIRQRSPVLPAQLLSIYDAAVRRSAYGDEARAAVL